MSTVRVVNIQHTDATEPNIVLEADGTTVFASGITISGGTNLTVSGTAEFASGTVSAPSITFIDDNNTGLYSPATDTVAITTAATERLRVDSAGNIGIGTTSPSEILEVKPTSNGDGIAIKNTGAIFGKFEFDSNRTSAGQVLGDISFNWNGTRVARILGAAGSDTTNKDDGQLLFYTAAAGSATEAMRIDSSGNVGIGTTSPAQNLDVASTSNIAYALDGWALAGKGDSSDILFGGILGSQFDTLKLYTSGSERLRIDSSGKLLVGTTTSPTTGSTAGYKLGINCATNSGPMGIVVDTTTRTATDFAKVFVGINESGTESIQLYSNGSARFNGTVSIGGTAAANTIDEYEEGTWTPIIYTESGSNYTLGNTHAKYTKIGRLVYVAFSLQFTAIGSGTITIFSLPFSRATGEASILNGYITSGNNRMSVQYTNYTSSTALVRLDDGDSYIQYWSPKSNWSATNTFVGTGVYEAA